jgi:DNA-binding response OmpR family regulator
MARRSTARSEPLQGENLKTTHAADARHWISIYADLLDFKRGLLARVQRDVTKLRPDARNAAMADVALIEIQMHGYEQRLELWYRRVWDLQGLWIDPKTHALSHGAKLVTLTKREFELVQLLLDHPHRFFTASQIASAAWADADLSAEEVRNYVRRMRKILAELEVPVDLINKPQRGYSLVFRAE